MQKLFDQFLREKRFLNNVSPTTLKYYQYVYNRWMDYIGEMPDKQNVKEFVIKIQESGVTVYTANSYIRGMNSILTWLAENEHCERFRIKKLREAEKVLKLFSESHMKAMLGFKPKTFAEHRLSAMVCFALDTGCRINEMLHLNRDNLNLDDLLATVNGKGDKERIVPISIEVRKILYKFLGSHKFESVFPTVEGQRLSYSTVLKQFNRFCEGLGITGVRHSWHTLRHTFASAYVRDGGNILYLQRILGHADLSVTRIYVKATSDDLTLMHRKTSLISRLK